MELFGDLVQERDDQPAVERAADVEAETPVLDKEIASSEAPLGEAEVAAVRQEVQRTIAEQGHDDVVKAIALMFGPDAKELGLMKQMERLRGELTDEAQELTAVALQKHSSLADRGLSLVMKVTEQVKLDNRNRAVAALAKILPLTAIGYGMLRGKRFSVESDELVEQELTKVEAYMYRAGVVTGLREGWSTVMGVVREKGFKETVKKMVHGIFARGIERIVDPLVEESNKPEDV